jgi:hypothetical protein
MEMVDGERGKKESKKLYMIVRGVCPFFLFKKMNSDKNNIVLFFIFLYNADNFNLSGKDKPPRLL